MSYEDKILPALNAYHRSYAPVVTPASDKTQADRWAAVEAAADAKPESTRTAICETCGETVRASRMDIHALEECSPMTATIRPIRCPHGADLTPESARRDTLCGVYADGCQCTSGIPPMFWCGPDEMSKPNGVRIYEGEYLRDWAEALILNEGDELYDEAWSLNTIKDASTHEWWVAEGEPKCTFRGLISKRPCTLPLDHNGVHSVWGTPGEPDEAARYLNEVPWSDRVDD